GLVFCSRGQMPVSLSWAVNRRRAYWRPSSGTTSRPMAANGRKSTKRHSSNHCATSSKLRAIHITQLRDYGMMASLRHQKRGGCWRSHFLLRSMRRCRKRGSAFSGCEVTEGGETGRTDNEAACLKSYNAGIYIGELQ